MKQKRYRVDILTGGPYKMLYANCRHVWLMYNGTYIYAHNNINCAEQPYIDTHA